MMIPSIALICTLPKNKTNLCKMKIIWHRENITQHNGLFGVKNKSILIVVVIHHSIKNKHNDENGTCHILLSY